MDQSLDDVLAHHGVKGMKWGVRRTREELRAKKETKKSDRALPTSHDAKRAAESHRIAKNAGLSKLSNKEIQDAVTRMNLEQQYTRLAPKTGSQKAKKFLSDILVNTGKQQAQKFANDQVNVAIEKQKKKQSQ